MYEVISFYEKTKWDKAIKGANKKDVYYFESYCSLYKTIGDGEPYLFVYTDKYENKIFYVFIKREIKLLPYLGNVYNFENIYDIITPYGYGGPLYDKGDAQVIKEFRKEFESYCQKENIVSEFIRFHPILENHKYLDDLLEVKLDRETIFIDLNKSEVEIFNNYHKNHKRNIKKAINNKLVFKIFQKEEALCIIDEFYKLYTETMDKLNAASYYYFSVDYIRQMLNGLYDNTMLGAVFYEGKMVSSALCMFDEGVIHYHLGCSKKEYLNLGVNTFQFHNIALWGSQKGFHTFHLGGGHVERDSLFQFKHRFNDKGTLQFYTGKKVHIPEKYKELLDKWKGHYSEEVTETFFPAYRYKTSDLLPVFKS